MVLQRPAVLNGLAAGRIAPVDPGYRRGRLDASYWQDISDHKYNDQQCSELNRQDCNLAFLQCGLDSTRSWKLRWHLCLSLITFPLLREQWRPSAPPGTPRSRRAYSWSP